MSTQIDLPQALPVTGAPPASAAALPTVLPVGPGPSVWDRWPLSWGRALVGWAWRLFVGAFLCANPAYLAFGVSIITVGVTTAERGIFAVVSLSYLTAFLAVGWTYRWMQAVVLRGWWKRSPKREQGTFTQFCDSLSPGAPAPRPRWFLRERIGTVMSRPGPGGRPASALRLFGRALTVPWHSLWLNFKTGLAGVFCTYLLTGWGCLLMMWSWEFGWLNSLNRHYEQAWVGPVTGILGSLLLILALFYVPMAQAHQAATGQARTFFDFRFVRQLVRARLTAYFGLVALILLASLVLSVMMDAVWSEEFPGNDRTLPIDERLAFNLRYYFYCSLYFLFPAYLLLHGLSALIYRSAVLKLLRQGKVTRSELNPVLSGWLDRLDLKVLPQAETTGLTWYAKLTARFAYRRVLFTLLFFVWVFFVMRHYVTHFFVARPVIGFLNHPMVQLPSFNFTPEHLYLGRED